MAFILVLCVSCCFFAGCGENGDSEEKEKLSFDPQDGPLVPYAEPLVVTQVRYQDPGLTFVGAESLEDNFMTDFYKEKLNIEWKSTWVSDPGSYYTKLNMDIAGNDLPDVMMVNGAQLQTLIENDQIEDLTDYYNYYASDLLKASVAYNDGYLLEYPTVDGRLYAIPLTLAYGANCPYMWIRTDWMEQLGLSAPTTYEEFCNYIRALKKSGLVSGGSSGFSFLGAGTVSFDAIAQMFGAYYDYYLDDNGELVYSSVTDEMKEALKVIQDMVKEGLIDSDWATKGSTEEERIASSSIGILFGPYWYPYLLRGSVMNNPKADWKAFPVPARDKNSVPQPKEGSYLQGYVVVRKGYEHPEALIKTLNLSAEVWSSGGEYNSWIAEKTTTDYNSVNLIGDYILPYAYTDPSTLYTISQQIIATLGSDNPDEEIKKYPFSQVTYSYLRDPSAPDYLTGNGWHLYKVYTETGPVLNTYTGNLVSNKFNGMLSEDAAFNKTALDTLMVETFTNIIMGESIDTFDAFVENWNDNGGSKIMKEVNEWYSSKK